MKKDDIVKFTDTTTKEKDKTITAIITKVIDENYVSCIDKNGKVFSHVYVGYIKETNQTAPLEEFLRKTLKE